MDIYAELTKKQLESLESGAKFNVPSGVSVNRKSGSRACYFVCNDKQSYREMVEALEDVGISWQDNS